MDSQLAQKDHWFKIALIFIGFLIALGLFGNIYLLLRKEKPKPIYQITPIPTQTSLPLHFVLTSFRLQIIPKS